MIYISLKLVKGEDVHDHRNEWSLFFKEVYWPSPPIPRNHDVRVAFGRDDNGEETGWSASPNLVWYDSNGDIVIEIQEGVPEDEYEKLTGYLINDEFLTYDTWKELHG